MSNFEDTVDASCQTEEGMMVDSFSQTLDGQMTEEKEEEELGNEEGTQTVLPDSVTLALAILANK